MAQPAHRELPVSALAVNLLGALLLAGGVVGLMVPDIGESVPALTDRLTAFSLIGVGVVLDFWSIPAILRSLRNRAHP